METKINFSTVQFGIYSVALKKDDKKAVIKIKMPMAIEPSKDYEINPRYYFNMALHHLILNWLPMWDELELCKAKLGNNEVRRYIFDTNDCSWEIAFGIVCDMLASISNDFGGNEEGMVELYSKGIITSRELREYQKDKAEAESDLIEKLEERQSRFSYYDDLYERRLMEL